MSIVEQVTKLEKLRNEIEILFNKTVEEVNSKKKDFKIPEKEQLELYAHYKQATIGDINIEQPYQVNFVAYKKWCVWNALHGQPKHVAMKDYIELVNKIKRQ